MMSYHPAMDPGRQESWEISRILRSCCRDFHIGELIEHGEPRGIYVVTPDCELGQSVRRDIEAIVLECGKPWQTKVRFFSKSDASSPLGTQTIQFPNVSAEGFVADDENPGQEKPL